MISPAIRAAQKRLIRAGFAGKRDFIGCTQQEIQSLEEHFRVTLPKCYMDFLSEMGRSAGPVFLVGSSYRFPSVLEYRADAVELLKKCEPEFTLPATAFVFFHHQGYSYLWFNCNSRDDDPPVIMFTELEKQPRQVGESFTDWLLLAVDDDIVAEQRL